MQSLAGPKISVCIPAYDMVGGGEFLRYSLDRIALQDWKDLEVVVADQSDTRRVAGICAEFTDRLTIRRIDTRNLARQASANTNAAIKAAKGEIVKILFQDDFLNVPSALSEIAKAFSDPAVNWVLCGTDHTRDGKGRTRTMVPKLNPSLRFGRNTVSSPSVLAVRRAIAPKFDEALIWLMDVDYYDQCSRKLGSPAILPSPLVVNRLHQGQVSNSVTRSLIRQELRHVAIKTPGGMGLADKILYARHLAATWF